MSFTKIPETVKIRLWGKSAGRCAYLGCNERLWIDASTQFEFNSAYIAHIIADSPSGPRGDPILSPKLATDISNLMLLCDRHHRLIDKEDVAGHPVERLEEMKRAHEGRVELLTDISEQKKSHVLLYGANIGAQASPLSFSEAALAMVPNWYPADRYPISLGLKNSSIEDHASEFWQMEMAQMRNSFSQVVQPRIKSGEIRHLSVFALAPQPLLVLLGSCLSDIPAVETYQLHRQPRTWKWLDVPENSQFRVKHPDTFDGQPVLVFSLSAKIHPERIHSVLPGNLSIWEVTLNQCHNDFLRSRPQLLAFNDIVRKLMVEISHRHGQKTPLNIFPAMPVACAVELGRLRMPKADMPWILFDQNNKLGGFVKTIEIGVSHE